jgi:cysteinyl-tRNA synthetase
MEISLYNTRTRKQALFRPIDPACVSLYCCGPTVYNYAHIGNARPPVLFGLLARVLKRIYPKVIYARNITDVDDKINESAAEQGVPISVITERFTAAYHLDTDAVGADRPDLEPRATAHIADIIAMCELLIARGHAYVAAQHVLFDVSSFADYGALSGRSLKEMIAGARVEVAPYKKSAPDFVLWKPSGPDLPGWDSPWGRGRPGWHIECSAMAKAHLGETIDIHAGGNDLLFPHHENEVAQSTCAHGGKTFANFWLHNGMLTVEGAKMSKSVGNVHLIKDVKARYPGEVMRYLLLSGHYRQPLDWSERTLEQAQTTLDRMYGALALAGDVDISGMDLTLAKPDAVMAALCDDLNSPNALAELSALTKDLNKAEGPTSKAIAKARLLAAGDLLGLLKVAPKTWLQGESASKDDSAHFDALLAERSAARAAKDFARADAIRKEFADAGVLIEDSATGPTWRRG